MYHFLKTVSACCQEPEVLTVLSNVAFIQGNENWTKDSSILQVLLSIQGNIHQTALCYSNFSFYYTIFPVSNRSVVQRMFMKRADVDAADVDAADVDAADAAWL